MDLGPDMVRDQADDPLGLRGSEPLTRIGHAPGLAGRPTPCRRR